MHTDEQLSPHEVLARKFEMWQKEYYEEVNAPFSRQDRFAGQVAFESWEQRFLAFLANEAPSLNSIYRKSVQSRALKWMFGSRVDQTWKSGKGEAVEAFLGHAITEARAERLISKSPRSIPGLSSTQKPKVDGKIFIGHGRSRIWRDLQDFLQERLKLQCDEFNSESVAGITTVARLEEMLDQASFAFLVMTAKDEHHDGSLHARENVIHEAGLFQGRLGFKKAILLLEDGCTEFSNIKGLTYIPFPTGTITAVYEEIRRVLEREGILK